jgi:hypothetical protein
MLRQRSDLLSLFAYAGEKSSSAGGAKRPPISGHSLYTKPASNPATKTPNLNYHRGKTGGKQNTHRIKR